MNILLACLKKLYGLLIVVRKLKSKFNKKPPIASIGDSWSNLTILNLFRIDIIDHLKKEFNIVDAAFPGHKVKTELIEETWRIAASDNEHQLFILSFGGNDYIWDFFGDFYDKQEKIVNTKAIESIVKIIVFQIFELIFQINKEYPKAHFLIHGYDFGMPYWTSPFWKGSLDGHKGLNDYEIDMISKVLLIYHNSHLEKFSADIENVTYCNLLGTLSGISDYLEDMHPSKRGAKKLAEKLSHTIKSEIPEIYWK